MPSLAPLPKVTLSLAGVAALASALGAIQRGIGARADERAAGLPGDDLVPAASVIRTHAISIPAPPSVVWPWVAQLGQERGGFYSYAALENLVGCRITNAEAIVPAWQQSLPGGKMHLHPAVALDIVQVDPSRALVVRSPHPYAGGPGPFDFSWAFVLAQEGAGTRLLIRERYCPAGFAGALQCHLVGPVAALMTDRMLRGIRERATRPLVHDRHRNSMST